MKKRVFLVVLMAIFLFPFTVNAAKSNEGYKSMNLEQALTEEGIEHNLKKYKESDDKINIYVFRGNGCPHCQEFLEFLNSIVDEYGKYFNVVSYEVWNDSKNVRLVEKVANFLGDSYGGVPYIVIGDKTFIGYAKDYDEGIKSAIKELYDSKERYDVFEEMDKAEEKAANGGVEKVDYTKIIAWIVGSVVCSTLVIFLVILIECKAFNQRIDAIYDALEIERVLSNDEIAAIDDEDDSDNENKEEDTEENKENKKSKKSK